MAKRFFTPIQFDTASTGTPGVGQINWDSSNGTAQIGLEGGNVTLQVGQEHVIRVKNSSGSVAIPDRTAVMVNGATGDTITVTPAIASNYATYPSDYFVGITTEEIPADGFGFVTQYGFINHVDTSAWTVGTLLYVDPATAGGLTSTHPTAPAWQTPIAAVTKQNGSAGRILVRAIPGIPLNSVEGVTISSPADNEVLAYDSATSTWINQTSAEAGLIDTSSTAQTKTGNFTSSGDIAAGGVLKSTASSANEGGQIELSIPSSGSTLSGTNVTIDVFQDKLRFFESGGTNRGAYIPLTSTGATVGTSLLGGTTGAMNASYTYASKQSAVSSAGTVLASVSITTNGYPIQVLATGDMENNSAGGWVTLQLYRGSTAIGNIVHAESSAGSENVPFALTALDVPSAGTYTYSLKINASAGGTFNFGESNGPTITVIELSGPKGDTGAAGTSPNAFTTIATTSGTSPVADSTSDTLTLSAGTGITVTGDSTTDTVTFATDSTTIPTLSAGNAFTGANTFTNASGIAVRNTSVRDGIILSGRAGGTASYAVTFTPTTLTSNRTITIPNATGTMALTSDIQTLTPGTAIDIGAGNTIDVDLSELSTSVTDGDGDYFVVVDAANAQYKLTKANINISGFNGDSLTLSGDIAVNGGDLTSTATTFNLLNSTVTTLNIGGAATTLNISSSTTGATSIIAGGTSQAVTFKTKDAVSGGTGALNIQTGANTGGGGVTSGNISIDVGAGNAGSPGAISVGTTNANSTSIGRLTKTTSLFGNVTVAASSNFLSEGTTDTLGSTNNGFYFSSANQFTFAASIANADTTPVMRINRNTSDGNLLRFAQDGTVEGTVSVSGTTVTYGTFAGIHWSQFKDHAKPDILPGTVLETIGEMCDWQKEDGTYEDNDQLPKVKVSETVESPSVYGVFMTWDGEDGYNDLHVLSLGAWLCRIDASEEVEIGDLLVSAGNGCAKVQSDDIIRSKTIGKVTSTFKQTVYEDGSYLVPTVFYCG